MQLLTNLFKKSPNIHILNGRPKGVKNKRYPKRDAVLNWRAKHPKGTQRQCIAATGFSSATVCKYWHDFENTKD